MKTHQNPLPNTTSREKNIKTKIQHQMLGFSLLVEPSEDTKEAEIVMKIHQNPLPNTTSREKKIKTKIQHQM